MNNVLENVEQLFTALGNLLLNYSKVALLLLGTITLFFALQVPKLQWDPSSEGYLSAADNSIQQYRSFQEKFGSNSTILVGIETSDVFQQPFLEKLILLHTELAEKIPYLTSISSLVNVMHVERSGDDVRLEKLLPEFVTGSMDSEAIKKKSNSKLVGERFISQGNDFTVIILQIANRLSKADTTPEQALAAFDPNRPPPSSDDWRALSNAENTQVVETLQRIAITHQTEDFKIFVSGTPLLKKILRHYMHWDTSLFILSSLLIIGLFLWLIFSSLSGMIIPLLVVVASVLCTVGLMVLNQKSIKSPTVMLPSFIMTMGVSGSIHLMAIYYRLLQEETDHREVIRKALAHSGLPVFVTSLTTSMGLLSFASAEISPIRDLGIFGAIGIIVAFFFTITLVPVVLNVFHGNRERVGLLKNGYQEQNKLLLGVCQVSRRHPGIILAICTVAIFVSFTGIPKIQFGHNPVSWLPDKLPLRIAHEKIQNKIGGVASIEVLIDSGVPSGALEPQFLEKLAECSKKLTGFTHSGITVTSINSLSDLIGNIHRILQDTAIHDNSMPDSRSLIAQEVLLLETAVPEQLSQLIDGDHALARIQLLIPWVDAISYVPFLNQLEKEIKAVVPVDAKVSITGVVPLLARTLNAAISSCVRSYLLAGIAICLFTMLVMGRLKLALISLLPNLLPIATILGIIGWTGAPMNMYTMLSGSIAIGLVVDDTIHFLYNFRKYHSLGFSTNEAIRETLLGTGRAILITSVVIACGAFICCFSSLSNLFYFGLFTGSAIILALLADFFLLPVLLRLAYPENNQAVQEEMKC